MEIESVILGLQYLRNLCTLLQASLAPVSQSSNKYSPSIKMTNQGVVSSSWSSVSHKRTMKLVLCYSWLHLILRQHSKRPHSSIKIQVH